MGLFDCTAVCPVSTTNFVADGHRIPFSRLDYVASLAPYQDVQSQTDRVIRRPWPPSPRGCLPLDRRKQCDAPFYEFKRANKLSAVQPRKNQKSRAVILAKRIDGRRVQLFANTGVTNDVLKTRHAGGDSCRWIGDGSNDDHGGCHSGEDDIAFGNLNDPPQGAINAKNPRSAIDPGPQNPAIRDQFPGAFLPPAADVGSMPLSWASFNNAPRRIQNGGCARQVTQESFAVADTISGVNMRLTAGGIREMHWHQFAEWAYMTYSTCRITTLDEMGRPYIADVKEGDIWYFPAGLPHSLQSLGPDGCEFLISFDEGKASEYTTLLMSEWFTHTPPDILAQNFGVPVETFQNIPLRDLYIFQGKEPVEKCRRSKRNDNSDHGWRTLQKNSHG
jgi:oxalate decarboxylase/phosphoglucose isomerase-like protein (cupin superfamily)